MNNYHKNHKDPEIREKYRSWEVAHGNYRARSWGFNSHQEMTEAQATKEETKEKDKFLEQLKNLGRAVMYGIARNNAAKKAQAAKKQNIRRSGANRGA
jgi:hypothetical protein